MKKSIFILSVLMSCAVYAQPGKNVPKKTPAPAQTTTVQKPVVKPGGTSASNIITLTVLPETVSCTNNPEAQCLQVKRKGSTEYETVDDIEKFNYEIGYTYTIQVKETMKTPPVKSGESIYRYVWIKTISRKEVTESVTEESIETTRTNTGAVIGKTDVYTTSPLDGKWYLRKMKDTDGTSLITDDNVMYIDIKTFNDRIDGFSACNKFATVLKTDINTTFYVSKLTTDYSYCGNKKIEELFYSLLQQVDKFDIKNGTLILSKQWNFLLGFTQNPDNKEEITTTYTPPAIVKNDTKTYATNENLNAVSPQQVETKPVESFNTTKTETTITGDAEAEEMQRKIDEMQKALAAKKQKAADEARKAEEAKLASEQVAEQKKKEELKQQQQKAEEQKKLAAAKAEKLKELERLQKELEEMDNGKTSSTSTAKLAENTTPKTTSTNPKTESNKTVPKPVPATTPMNTVSSSGNNPQLDLENVVYYFKGNTPVILDRTTGTFKGSAKNNYLEMPTSESTLQYHQNRLPKLMVRFAEDINPDDFMHLHICDFKKDIRIINLTPKKNILDISFKNIEGNLYEIIMPENLEINEYAFITNAEYNKINDATFNSTTSKVNCFGVNEVEANSTREKNKEKYVTENKTQKKPESDISIITTTNFKVNSIENIPEPDYSFRPYYLDGNELKSIEHVDAKSDIKVKGMGYGGSDMFYTVFKKESSIQFSLNNLPRFFIQLETSGDPNDAIQVCSAIITKDRRRFKTGSMTMMGGSRDVSNQRIQLNFKKIRTGLFEIIFPENLPIGEYAFLLTKDGAQQGIMSYGSTSKIDCFGVAP